jgi:hypothetical protein
MAVPCRTLPKLLVFPVLRENQRQRYISMRQQLLI